MKLRITHLIGIAGLLLLLAGCSSIATEEDKAAFHKSTLGFENMQQQTQFNQAIDNNYAPGVGGPPAWEAPAN